MTVGELFKALRKELKLSQETFAAKYNRGQADISRIETGKAEPDIELMCDVAQDTGSEVLRAVIFGQWVAKYHERYGYRENWRKRFA